MKKLVSIINVNHYRSKIKTVKSNLDKIDKLYNTQWRN